MFDSSQLKEFADDNFKFDENGRKLSKWASSQAKDTKVVHNEQSGVSILGLRRCQMGRKHCGKKGNCSLRAISPFPTVFSKGLFPRGVKRCHCVEMGQGCLS